MIRIRLAEERGHADHGWLDTRHSFSFGDYRDSCHMGFRSLRVINEDRVQPGRGFDTHPHRDMEILTYVLNGALAHRDSTGSTSVIRPGEIQRMSAGTGIEHSEYNQSESEPVHFLQIWILPERLDLVPGYEQRRFDLRPRDAQLVLIASKDGRQRSLTVHQNITVHAAILPAGRAFSHSLATGRHAWIQVARGSLSLNGHPLHAGDGAAISGERALEIIACHESEVLLFDLA